MEEKNVNVLEKLQKRSVYQKALGYLVLHYSFHNRRFAWSERAFSLTEFAIRNKFCEDRKVIDCFKLKQITLHKAQSPIWLAESALTQMLSEGIELDIDEHYKAVAWIMVDAKRKSKEIKFDIDDLDKALLTRHVNEVLDLINLETRWKITYSISDKNKKPISTPCVHESKAWKEAEVALDSSKRQLRRMGCFLSKHAEEVTE